MAVSEPVDVPTRILDAAQRCFYRWGITATGVDTLAEEAGVSKRTLYNHFGSKDGLVTAYLRRREETWRRTLAELLDAAGDDPVARVLAYARGYARPVDDTTFRGCAFINAAAELADDEHPALGVVRSSIDTVQRGVRQILADAGVADPDSLASQVLVVLEGAVAIGGIRRSDAIFDDAERLIETLIRPHLP
ncbi:MAG TPA: TetR/AcrR family transcriptional regulator [Jiangellaceae bacterium]|nr:TetR/AcrR family transcriptional regulator [Jiangellaceae bacterium]